MSVCGTSGSQLQTLLLITLEGSSAPAPANDPWRYISAGGSVASGERAIYAQGGLGYVADGSELSMMAAIGVSDGAPVSAGGVIRYMPVTQIMPTTSLSTVGDVWARDDGALVPFSALNSGKFSRRIGSVLPPNALAVDFGPVAAV